MHIDIKRIIDRKEFHIAILIIIVVIILFSALLIMLKYSEEGEKNLPFNISKITIVSSVEGKDNEDPNNKWNLTVNQNNDFYFYVEKNKLYKEKSILEKITFENFTVQGNNSLGNKELYKPDSVSENVIFRNAEENKVSKIDYENAEKTSIKDCKISNQGGLLVFRYANENVGQYVSNEDEEINHQDLLKKINSTQESLSFIVNFDMIMCVQGGTVYKANINLELPKGDVINGGTQSNEITDVGDIVFRRQ